MIARRTAGILAIAAALVVLVAAFLPRVTIRDEVVFREVDLSLPTARWLLPLVVALTHAALYAVPGVRLLLGRAGDLATGVLLGLGVLQSVGSMMGVFALNPELRPAIGMWLTTAAGGIALLAALLALGARTGPPTHPTAPPGDHITG